MNLLFSSSLNYKNWNKMCSNKRVTYNCHDIRTNIFYFDNSFGLSAITKIETKTDWIKWWFTNIIKLDQIFQLSLSFNHNFHIKKRNKNYIILTIIFVQVAGT